jgi:hypothetical protein
MSQRKERELSKEDFERIRRNLLDLIAEDAEARKKLLVKDSNAPPEPDEDQQPNGDQQPTKQSA